MKRRLVLGAMFVVTAWSLWAFAQSNSEAGHRAHVHSANGGVVERGDGASAKGGVVERGVPSRTGTNEGPSEGESDEPAPINWTAFGATTPPFLAPLVNFGILVAGYYLLGKRPIMAGLVARRDAIAGEIEQASRMLREAQERAKTYQAKLETLENEVRLVRDGLIRAGETERDRIVSEAEAKAERMRKEAEFLAVQEFKQVRQGLLRDTVEAAVAAAEELLAKRVTPADQERLADDYLADLAGRKSTSIAPSSSRPPRPSGREPS